MQSPLAEVQRLKYPRRIFLIPSLVAAATLWQRHPYHYSQDA